MIIVFQILSMIFAGVAGYFFYTDNTDGVFLSAVLGALSFFLSIRFQVKGRLVGHNAERDERRSADIDES